jgi:hypothetical protein
MNGRIADCISLARLAVAAIKFSVLILISPFVSAEPG